MPEIRNHIDANYHWQEFANDIAKVIVTRDEYERVISLAQKMIYAALNDDIAPCMERSDHQFNGSTYSACVKCGEPEH